MQKETKHLKTLKERRDGSKPSSIEALLSYG